MRVRFLDTQGTVFDERDLERVPRVGEGLVLDGRPCYVGAVSTHIQTGHPTHYEVTALQHEEARRFLGGGQ
jgi:hypothetical protein